MIRRILIFLILLALAFVAYRYFNPDGANEIIDSVTEFPGKVFDTKDSSTLTITGTTLHIIQKDTSDESVPDTLIVSTEKISENIIEKEIVQEPEDNILINSTGQQENVVGSGEIEENPGIVLLNDEIIEADEIEEVVYSDTEELNIEESNTEEVATGKNVTEEIVNEKDSKKNDIKDVVVEKTVIDEKQENNPTDQKKTVVVTTHPTVIKTYTQASSLGLNSQDIIDTKHLFNSLIK